MRSSPGRACTTRGPLGEFQSWFATDADCLDYLDWLRWPDVGDGGDPVRSQADTADRVVHGLLDVRRG